MDPNTTFDQNRSDGLPLAESGREWPGLKNPTVAEEVRFPGEDGGKSLAAMAERDLNATLQLLAERAQYITGATGAAIAVMDHNEMVCKASAGLSTPEIGARLQMDSGLSGESIRTRETLRCDDIKTDGRVNRESCEELGIASVVIMPILEGEEVIGVFELFSNHPHAFQDRDIVALERMGFMVRTALAQNESAQMEKQVKKQAETQESASSVDNGDVSEGKTTREILNEGNFAGLGPEEDEEDAIDAPAPQTAASLEESELIAEIRRFAREKGLTISRNNQEGDVQTGSERPKIAFHGAAGQRKVELPGEPNEQTVVASSRAEDSPKLSWVKPEVEPFSSATSIPKQLETANSLASSATDSEPANPKSGASIVGGHGTEEVASAGKAAEEKPVGIKPAPDVPASDTAAQSGVGLPTAKNESTEKTAGSLATQQGSNSEKEKSKLDSRAASGALIADATPVAEAPTARSVEKARTAVAGLGRCEVCGFPVSEGRKLCLDCVKKKPSERASEITAAQAPVQAESSVEVSETKLEAKPAEPTESRNAQADVDAPQFLMDSSDHESWVIAHKFTVVAVAIVLVGLIVYLLSR